MDKDKINKKRRERYQLNINKNREKQNKYYAKNKEKNRVKKNEQQRRMYNLNKEKIREQIRKRRTKNKEKINKQNRSYYHAKDKQKEKLRKQEYRRKNIDRIRNRNKEYYKRTKETRRKIRNKSANKYRIKRQKSDVLYYLCSKIRASIKKTFKKMGYTKKSRTSKILGCTFDEFKIHIESQFEPWMNWSNHGNWNGYPTELNVAWDLDHIIPVSVAKTEEEIIRLNHYTNFQPLCSYTNRHIKKNKMPEEYNAKS